MTHQNRYCTRCGKTTLFWIDGTTFTCTNCGVRVEPASRKPDQARSLVGDPFHSFRIRFV